MAIDTVADRFSMMDMSSIDSPAMPIPSGSIDEGARLHLLWLYGGIAAGAAQVVVTPSDRRIIFMRSNRTIPR